MLRENHKLLLWFRIVVDYLATVFFWLGAYYVRFKIIGGGDPNLGIFYLKISPIMATFYIYSFFKNDLYLSQRLISWQKELVKTVVASLFAFTLVIFFSYLIMGLILSRITLGIFFLSSTIGFVIIRIIIRNILQSFRKKGKNLRYIMAIGFGDKLEEYLEKVKESSSMGIIVDKVINPAEEAVDFPELLKNDRIHQIVVSFPEGNEMVEAMVLKACSNQLIPVSVISSIPYSFIGSDISDFKGIPILEFNSPSLNLTNRFLKRVLDILGSLFGLIVLSPLYLILAIAVKVTSKGPVFYGQERMTREGRVFKMWKFRSMKVGAEKVGDGWTVKDDPRRTVIGPFLRSTSLDELPQLWNVFVGQMSLVGPRPERPVFIDKFKEEIPAYMLRHKMKAGITGWAQVNGWRGDTSIPKRIECDLFYIKNWSLILDIRILLLTFVKGFINKNAY